MRGEKLWKEEGEKERKRGVWDGDCERRQAVRTQRGQ